MRLVGILLCVSCLTAHGQNGAEGGRFQPMEGGEQVKDARTGLVWKRCPEGKQWTGNQCSGTATQFGLDAWLLLADSQKAWRVPNIKELASLMTSPEHVDWLGADKIGSYWSSTPHVGAPRTAWFADLRTGTASVALRHASLNLLLVRESTQDLSASRPIHDTGVSNLQCISLNSDVLVPCDRANTGAGAALQDGVLGRASADSNTNDGQHGFSFSHVKRPDGSPYAISECVYDNVTGLVWEGKPSDGSVRDYRNRYTNYNDTQQAQTTVGSTVAHPTQEQIAHETNAFAYVQWVNRSGLCGFSDWRLPTVQELFGLTDLGMGSAPVAEPTWLSNTSGQWFYWTSDPSWFKPSLARTVTFSMGRVGGTTRSTPGHIRLVRGTP
ncbi:MAG: Lcl C-terminal domain-containing protein [Rhodoferax sp.]